MDVPSLQLAFLTLSVIFSTSTTAVGGAFLSFPSASPPPPPSVSDGHSPQFREFPLSSASLLEQILAHLGFQELSISVVTALSEYPALSRWNGPVTIFAPSDASVESCSSCPLPRLLAEHVVPGFFSTYTLQGLAFGTKIETMNPRHCVAVAYASDRFTNATRIYIGGAEITRPDLFDNGLMIVHGLDGPVSPLSQSSCTDASPRPSFEEAPPSFAGSPPLIMTLMLRDAMLRLRSGGYGVLALAMKAKFSKLVALENATIFAVEDDFIFSDPHNYAGDVSFHIVPNRYLAGDDLQKLPVGSTLGTMEAGEDLVVTSAGTPAGGTVQINGAPLKIPEVIRNARVVVHSLFLPFSHLQFGSLSPGPALSVLIDGSDGEGEDRTAGDASESLEELGGCGLGPTQIEDGHGP
ncbi:fasciclin-like arabinogalactan protein 21 [Rhodamnia argentea]|uniref:Fasciclin-like arabinogalactan protein 21 n=1 Tax=Rhodamnia argentea TaxID=178133 RepID=A0A8B8Q2C7_9MYRT|nr:fasciclin-like arabinogalactan protein 21 [Rhodamnia argentea]